MESQVVQYTKAVSVTVNTAVQPMCRAIWIGVAQSLDFTIDGTDWILLKGATAGSIVPINAIGIRKTAAGAANDAGDVLFLY